MGLNPCNIVRKEIPKRLIIIPKLLTRHNAIKVAYIVVTNIRLSYLKFSSQVVQYTHTPSTAAQAKTG